MVRVITQETFDEVVKENIEEFEMSPEEAVKEATAQFEAQGVDLSNIIKELALGDDEDHLVTITIGKLKELAAQNSSEEMLLKELAVLKAECEKDLAHRVRAGKDGAYTILLDLAEKKEKIYSESKKEKDGEFLIAVLNTLTSLMDVQPDLLDHRGMAVIKRLFNSTKEDEVLIALLKWCSMCCVKHETNRQSMFANNIPQKLNELLQESKNPKLQSEVMQLIRNLTLDDDIRVEFGKAHEHARDMGFMMLDTLAGLLKETKSPNLLSEIMWTISCLLVRNELCESMSGTVARLVEVAADNFQNAAVVQRSAKLITALAGNDDVKRKLMAEGVAPIIVSMLNRHASNATTSTSLLKCISALCLREPGHSQQLVCSGAAEALVHVMNVHRDCASIQKNGCWAVRNMVARYREANVKFHELGVEEILNKAYERYSKDFGFDIKSALRDLECNVKLDEQWTGKGVQIEN